MSKERPVLNDKRMKTNKWQVEKLQLKFADLYVFRLNFDVILTDQYWSCEPY